MSSPEPSRGVHGEDRAAALERLSETLRVLGTANRLDLLQKLLVPRTTSEISIAPSRDDADRNAERPISRQSLDHHLERLQSVGLVAARAAKRDGRSVTEWQTNAGRVFLVADELRRLSATPPSTTATMASPDGAAGELGALPPGPCLLLANGPWEGRAWALDGPGPWRIGRERDKEIAITYDPFVSREHAIVRRAGSALEVEVASKRNATLLNWRPVDGSSTIRLVPGDTLGVGRSLLVVRGG